MINKIKKNWYHFIGILIFLYIIFYKVNLIKIKEVILDSNIIFIVLAIIMSFIMFLVQSWRWNYLKKIQNINYSFRDSFLIYGSGIYFGTITPGRLGDLIKILYLKENGYSTGKSAVSVIIDRLADLIFLFSFGYISMFFFVDFFISEIIIITLAIVLIITIIFLLKRGLLTKGLGKIFSLIIPHKYKELLAINIRDLIIDFKIYRFKNYLVLLIMTTMTWLIYYLIIFALAKSINLDITFYYLAVSVTISAIITLLPISIYGLGVREATLLLLFSLINISPEKTITFSISILFIVLINGLIGFLCWLKKPLKNNNKKLITS